MKKATIVLLNFGLWSCVASEPTLPLPSLSPSPVQSSPLTMPSPLAPMPSLAPTPMPEPPPSGRMMKAATGVALAAPIIPYRYLALGDWDNHSVQGGSYFVVLNDLTDVSKIMRDPENLGFSEAQKLTSLDFSKERAIFVCDKVYPCFYLPEIVAVEETPQSLVIHTITWDSLSGGCLTAVSQPFAIVAVPRSEKPVQFKPIVFEDQWFRPNSRPSPNVP